MSTMCNVLSHTVEPLVICSNQSSARVIQSSKFKSKSCSQSPVYPVMAIGAPQELCHLSTWHNIAGVTEMSHRTLLVVLSSFASRQIDAARTRIMWMRGCSSICRSASTSSRDWAPRIAISNTKLSEEQKCLLAVQTV